MLQSMIIFLDGALAGWQYSLINGIYSIVAKLYDMMINIVCDENVLGGLTEPLENLILTLYVLAGVFMLFRVAIGMIQMLINPDAVTDKQAGAGKMVMRIVTSIVMLLLFVPNGLLFGSNGIFHRVENALLSKGDEVTGKRKGLVMRIADINFNKTSGIELPSGVKKGTASFLIENVYAASTPDLTCYFVNIKEHSVENNKHSYNVGNIFKIEFYNNKNGGKKSIDGSNWSYTVRSDQRIAGKSENGKYADLTGPITIADANAADYAAATAKAFTFNSATTCPKSLEKQSDGSWAPRLSYPNKATNWMGCSFTIGDGKKTCPVGIIGGYGGKGDGAGGLKALTNDLKQLKKSGTVTTNNKYVAKYAVKTKKEKAAENRDYLKNVDQNSIDFIQGVASSLQECSSDKTDDCKKAQKEMFITKEGHDDVVDLIKDGDLDIAFIMTMLTGIALVVYIILLSIEVIIRRLKLYFLEIIAPIPAIAYVDPKDKIFNQWMKIYLSTYIDLFIKLIAIGMAVAMLGPVIEGISTADNMLEKFFIIIAVFAFAKVMPTMISKIFGLDSMGNSFKDIASLGKTALGIGGVAAAGALTAGAAIGTGVKMFHATKGQSGLQRTLAAGQAIGSGVGATVQGMGSAKKGNYLAGVKNISDINANRRGKYEGGLKPTDLLAASTLGKFGATTAQKTDRKLAPLNQESERVSDVNKVKDQISSIASGSDFGKYVDGLAANGKIDSSQAKKWKEEWTQAQIDYDNGNYVNFNAFRASVQNNSAIGGYTGDLNEKGKMAQIRQQMTSLNDMIAGDPTISSVVGTQPITSYAGVKDADKAANDRKEQIFNQVSKATQSSEYRTSKAALESNSGNKKS